MSSFRDAEKAVIATMLTRPETISRAYARLTPEDFGTQLYRDAFRVLTEDHRDGQPPHDILSLRSRGIEFPMGFLDILTDVNDIDRTIATVQEGGFRHRVWEYANTLAETAYSVPREKLTAALGQFTEDISDHPTMFDHQAAVDAYASSLSRRNSDAAGLPWGWADMDDVVQPAVGGDMIVIAARPSVGKTSFAENIADNWSYEAARPVLFVSAEMRLSQLMDRAVSRISDIPAQRLLRGRLGPSDEEKVREALRTREHFNLFYVDDGRATTASIRQAAQRVKASYGGLTAIIVDYIQLLADQGEEGNTRVSRISRTLKAIAREFDVPLVALSQLSRQSQYRKDPRPRLEDLRDSGAIEQDADIVLGLFQDSNDVLECIVLKNRQGNRGTIQFSFDKDHVRVTDVG